ncbi:hypothetical protein EVAR_80142_1 [Eumeta japonica]|uniref:Uncharacterized protein n=1 Tax=Eumeta variegata TaxID=151549 RepID=A0A4C1YEC6_EUMVA|nr:hypothetical protein EVAR_80142_1 [Eumeta japonica]
MRRNAKNRGMMNRYRIGVLYASQQKPVVDTCCTHQPPKEKDKRRKSPLRSKTPSRSRRVCGPPGRRRSLSPMDILNLTGALR